MTAPTLAPGTWVQLNPSTESPRAGKPSAEEQTIGKITQSFMTQGEKFYQVVWNPGDMNPKTGTYREKELTELTQQQAQSIRQSIAAGNYQASLPQQGSNYQAPELETPALPPNEQPTGQYSL